MFLWRTRVLIATVWTGSLWTVGYLVAPTLFATLTNKALAGTIAGAMFRIEAWLSIGCAILLILLQELQAKGDVRQRRICLGLIGTMLGCTLLGYFALHPFMDALRAGAGPDGVMVSAARERFGMLHGISSAFYLLESLLAMVLAIKVAGSKPQK